MQASCLLEVPSTFHRRHDAEVELSAARHEAERARGWTAEGLGVRCFFTGGCSTSRDGQPPG